MFTQGIYKHIFHHICSYLISTYKRCIIFLICSIFHNYHTGTEVKVAQSCPVLCDPMDYTVHGIFQATGVGSLSLLQGILPTQGSNPGLPHCRQILTS